MMIKNKSVANRNVARQPRTNDEQDSDRILLEVCLKCIILVTNLQKSPYAGNSPPLAQHYPNSPSLASRALDQL